MLEFVVRSESRVPRVTSAHVSMLGKISSQPLCDTVPIRCPVSSANVSMQTAEHDTRVEREKSSCNVSLSRTAVVKEVLYYILILAFSLVAYQRQYVWTAFNNVLFIDTYSTGVGNTLVFPCI
jgi:hypothetical protein